MPNLLDLRPARPTTGLPQSLVTGAGAQGLFRGTLADALGANAAPGNVEPLPPPVTRGPGPPGYLCITLLDAAEWLEDNPSTLRSSPCRKPTSAVSRRLRPPSPTGRCSLFPRTRQACPWRP